MAFINERIPEEQKSRFDPKIFINPRNLHLATCTDWQIDQERDAFLIRLGGGSEPFQGENAPKPIIYMLLSWKGEIIKFEANYKEEGKFIDRNLVGYWDVLEIHLPQTLVAQREAVLQLIEEGLEAKGGFVGARERLIKVNIHFKAQQ